MSRITQIIISVLILPLVLIAVAILALLVLLINHYAPFYKQKRKRGDEEFTCYKLQTMRPSKDHAGIADPKADLLRRTAFGDLLRDHGWDELPQIINVLAGHMNFIGPRPLYESDLRRLESDIAISRQLLAEWRSRREAAPGGLTGWQQVHQLSFMHDPVAAIGYDLEYLKNPSSKKRRVILARSPLILLIGKKRFFGSGN